MPEGDGHHAEEPSAVAKPRTEEPADDRADDGADVEADETDEDAEDADDPEDPAGEKVEEPADERADEDAEEPADEDAEEPADEDAKEPEDAADPEEPADEPADENAADEHPDDPADEPADEDAKEPADEDAEHPEHPEHPEDPAGEKVAEPADEAADDPPAALEPPAAEPRDEERTVEAGTAGGSGRMLRRYTAGAVAFLLVLALASYWFDLGPRWLGWTYPSPVTQPAEVPPPPGLTLPAQQAAGAVARPAPERAIDPTAVRKSLAAAVRDKDLGRNVAVDVAQLSNGQQVYTHGPGLITPASTMKLLTTTAALSALGPDHRFRTSVVAPRTSNQVTLVGGGDPLLARNPNTAETDYPVSADLRTLAKSTARSLKESARTRIRLNYDTSLFSGPSVNPAWPSSYISGNVISRISPLWVDEGRRHTGLLSRSADPAMDAARIFASHLQQDGIKVVGQPRLKVAPKDAQELAFVRSAPLAQIVQHILEVSDNEGAEVLARQVAIKEGQPASFAGGVVAVRKVLTRLGVDLAGDRFYDGSGLSRHDRLHPDTLLKVIETASSPSHPELRPVTTDLPVAGFTGSLAYRFETSNPAGLGRVRAKTGTLTGVSGLAGTVTSDDGSVMAFVAIADKVKVARTLGARAALDQIASALAGCRCSATPSAASTTP